MVEDYLKNIVNDEYLINVVKIEKNEESTVGNVYIVYTANKRYVLKIYEDLVHTESMILLHSNISKQFNIPKIIDSKNNIGYVKILGLKYIVLYSFLDGVQLGKKFSKLNENLIKKIALELRRLHELTSNSNKYGLKNVPFGNDYNNNIKRYSLLHFDLTKGNIFYNAKKDSVGFIDFDDAKYGPSVYDVSILIALLFFSKKSGVDLCGVNLFIDNYYDKEIELKSQEIKYIKKIAIDWIEYTLGSNNFDTLLKESFEVKKKLIEENL